MKPAPTDLTLTEDEPGRAGVRLMEVTPSESEQRLDRWFRRQFPDLNHGRLEKLLRTGQVRIDGKRAKSGDRVSVGQIVRVPPLPAADAEPAAPRPPRPVPPERIKELHARILYRDDAVIAIDKPAGLAVQGGTNTDIHLDGMLDALRFEADERPRLVHRLDRETSGVLLLARTAAAARWLTQAFREKTTRKVYWAAVVGAPKMQRGKIDMPLARVAGSERFGPAEEGKAAVTYYATVDHAGRSATWLALMPLTGRTHQLRVHCAEALGTPIVGDRRYGGAEAMVQGLAERPDLHLHARSIIIPRSGAKPLSVTAPLPAHMGDTWDFFGFSGSDGDPFGDLDIE